MTFAKKAIHFQTLKFLTFRIFITFSALCSLRQTDMTLIVDIYVYNNIHRNRGGYDSFWSYGPLYFENFENFDFEFFNFRSTFCAHNSSEFSPNCPLLYDLITSIGHLDDIPYLWAQKVERKLNHNLRNTMDHNFNRNHILLDFYVYSCRHRCPLSGSCLFGAVNTVRKMLWKFEKSKFLKFESE